MVILTNIVPPSEGIRHQQEHTQAHVKGNVLGSGTLYVAESQLAWRAENGQGFCLDYPAISLHAVSRDLTAYPHECLYLMVDSSSDAPEPIQQNGSSDSDEESNSDITEIRFVPDDKTALDRLYMAMSDCQVLHPDPHDDSFSEDDDEQVGEEEVGEDEGGSEDTGRIEDGLYHGFYQSPDDVVHLTPEGQATLQRLETMLISGQPSTPPAAAQTQNTGTTNGGTEPGDEMDTGQFDDA